MTLPDLFEAEGWNGVERRAGGANPLRVAITFDREKWMARVRGTPGQHRSRAASTNDASTPGDGDSPCCDE